MYMYSLQSFTSCVFEDTMILPKVVFWCVEQPAKPRNGSDDICWLNQMSEVTSESKREKKFMKEIISLNMLFNVKTEPGTRKSYNRLAGAPCERGGGLRSPEKDSL